MVKIPKLFSFLQFRLGTLFFIVIIFAILGGWWSDHQRMVEQIYELQNPGPRWDTKQATGPPDTPQSGDIQTAWASSTPDAGPEWLVLDYETPVTAQSVEIHETYNPGAVHRISVFGADGKELIAWSGIDPTPTSALRGISRIPLGIDFAVTRIKVYIDSAAVPGWNEIDAVGLVDEKGRTHWATRAYASSSFGRNNELPVWYK